MSRDAFYKLQLEHASWDELSRCKKLLNQEHRMAFIRFCEVSGKTTDDIEAVLQLAKAGRIMKAQDGFRLGFRMQENVYRSGTLLAGRDSFLAALLSVFPGLSVSGVYEEGENSKGVIKGWEKIEQPTGDLVHDNSTWLINNEPKLWHAFLDREMRKSDGETTADLDALANQFLAVRDRRLVALQAGATEQQNVRK